MWGALRAGRHTDTSARSVVQYPRHVTGTVGSMQRLADSGTRDPESLPHLGPLADQRIRTPDYRIEGAFYP